MLKIEKITLGMPHGRLPLSVTNHSLLLGCLPQAITSWSMPHGRMPLAITSQSMPHGHLPLSVSKKPEYAAWTLATFLVSLSLRHTFILQENALIKKAKFSKVPRLAKKKIEQCVMRMRCDTLF